MAPGTVMQTLQEIFKICMKYFRNISKLLGANIDEMFEKERTYLAKVLKT